MSDLKTKIQEICDRVGDRGAYEVRLSNDLIAERSVGLLAQYIGGHIGAKITHVTAAPDGGEHTLFRIHCADYKEAARATFRKIIVNASTNTVSTHEAGTCNISINLPISDIEAAPAETALMVVDSGEKIGKIMRASFYFPDSAKAAVVLTIQPH